MYTQITQSLIYLLFVVMIKYILQNQIQVEVLIQKNMLFVKDLKG